MAPKKAKAKAKVAAPPKVEEKEDPEMAEKKRLFLQRKAASKWATAQLESVQIPCRAAEKAEVHWLAELHGFHEVELIKIVRRLDKKELDDVPEEERGKIAAYLAQCAGKAPGDVDQASFLPMKDIWDWTTAGDGPKYVRPVASSEEEAVAERLAQWSDASTGGMEGLTALMRQHAAAPLVQQLGLIRIGALCPEDGDKDKAADVSGMKSRILVPTIDTAMRAHDQDIMVLRGGYAALRGLAVAPGQLSDLCSLGGARVGAEMLFKHFKDEELASTANMAFYAMATRAKKNSPELAEMKAAGVGDALGKVITYHAWNHALATKVKLTMPFLTEE